MPPIVLAKKILDLDEQELVKILRQLEMEDRDLYNALREKIEDTI
jgi:hypothetical protein